MPKFVLFLRDDGRWNPQAMSPDEMQAIIKRYGQWRAKVTPALGHKLHDGEGRVMRRESGSVKVTDGPFAEAREVMGGLFVIEASDYDAAIEIARDCPHLDFGTIEIRQIQPTPGGPPPTV